MTKKSHERRAIIIGGSIAGLFVGAFLRRSGWRVDIYERSSIELIGRGVEIFATHPELLEALDKFGAGTFDIGVIVYKHITLDRRGDVIAEKPQLQIVTSWDRLRQVLLKAIDRALGVYNSVRQPLSERIVSHGRKLGMQLGVGINTDEDRAFAKLLQSPKGIPDWIAVPNFLVARS